MNLPPKTKEERVTHSETLDSKVTVLSRHPKRKIEDGDDKHSDKKQRLLSDKSFIYTKLQSLNQELRLLILKPSTYKKADIRCEIVTEALQIERVATYDALSYTWGSPGDICEQPISVRGCDMEVSRNLELALRALRYPTATRTLWVDAICINQQNNQERSQQVSLMRKIYSMARKTIVWLGEEDADSTRAIEWMSKLCPWRPYVGYELKPTRDLIPWEAIIRLFRRPWFTRIWVVQEFVVGRDVEFLVGTKSLRAETLNLTASHLGEPGTLVQFMNGSNFELEETKRVSRMFKLKESENQPVISQVLADFRNRGAFIPHDKIYALLGLCKDPTIEAPVPNYDKPFRYVCLEWATCSIMSEKNLGTLHSCEGHHSSPGWPSWVPDWSRRSTSVVFYIIRQAISIPP
jgi:hypothetical protein